MTAFSLERNVAMYCDSMYNVTDAPPAWVSRLAVVVSGWVGDGRLFTVLNARAPHQNRGSMDCGLATLYNIVHLIVHDSVRYGPEVLTPFRQRVLLCMLYRHLCPDPSDIQLHLIELQEAMELEDRGYAERAAERAQAEAAELECARCSHG